MAENDSIGVPDTTEDTADTYIDYGDDSDGGGVAVATKLRTGKKHRRATSGGGDDFDISGFQDSI